MPVVAEKVPADLPDEVIRATQWSKKKGRVDRSGQLHALVAVAMSHGYSDGQTMAIGQLSEPGQDKWPNPDDLYRGIQMSIEKLRPNHDHVGLTCREAGCPTVHHPQLLGQLLAIEGAFKSNYRPGRSLKSDSMAMDAFLLLAHQLGDLVIDMSVRQLAKLAGVSRATAEHCLRRLTRAEYLSLITEGDAGVTTPGSGPFPNHGYRYRLTCPGAEPMTHNHTPVFCAFEGSRAFEMLDPKHELWHFTGLHRERRTFEALVIGLTTIPEIADYQGLTPRTIKEHLTALSLHGMAEVKSDGQTWMAHDRPPDEVAQELGTLGKGRERNAQYSHESKNYSTWLVLRKKQRERELREMEDRLTQELIDKGFRWFGSFLMRTEVYEKSQSAKAKRLSAQLKSQHPRHRVRYTPASDIAEETRAMLRASSDAQMTTDQSTSIRKRVIVRPWVEDRAAREASI
ncbi:MAG: hypothetical protein IVW51_18910 [Thermaceae bacterium]|nr:hypothetical protein [Thermaceae bacterium]